MKTRITLLVFLIGFFSLTASAELVTWIGSAAGEWTTAANWSTTAVPGAVDDVIIPANYIVTVSTGAGTINSLSVEGKLIVAQTGSLTVEQNTALTSAAATNPIVKLFGGEIENAGTLTLKNSNSNQNSVVLLDNSPDVDNKFINNGTLNIDNSAGSYTGTNGRCISAKQSAMGRTSTFKLGGTLNLNLKATSVFVEADGGNLIIDGNLSIGSTDNNLNLRFLKLIGQGAITIAQTADITFYSGFVSGNGAVNIQSSQAITPGATFTNNGHLKLIGGEATTGYGVYLNANGANALATFNNNGILEVNGNFPMGALYIGGNATGINTINNAAAGQILLYNPNPATSVLKMSGTITTVPPLTLNNDGVIKVSTESHNLLSATAINGTGTIEYNYIAGVKPIAEFKGKVFASKQAINIQLVSGEKAQFVISDITGKIVKTGFLFEQSNIINTEKLQGIYIVKLLLRDGSYVQKVSLK